VISGSVRGFPQSDFFRAIRHRPPAAMLALLERRLRHYPRGIIESRMAAAHTAAVLMTGIDRPGSRADDHTHWVFPIRCAEPEKLMRFLWTKGIDATRGASSLHVVEPPPDRPGAAADKAAQAYSELLYLPVYAGVTRPDIERIAQAVSDFEAGTAGRG